MTTIRGVKAPASDVKLTTEKKMDVVMSATPQVSAALAPVSNAAPKNSATRAQARRTDVLKYFCIVILRVYIPGGIV